MQNNTIRLFVIDDHPIVVDGIRYRLHSEQDRITVVASALNVHDAIPNLKLNAFDIIILDLYIPNCNPLDNVKTLKDRFRDKKIIIFTSESASVWVSRMIKEGVNAYLTKDLSDSQFISAIYKVFNGEAVFPIDVSSINITNGKKDFEREQQLLPIQRKIIKLLSDGLSVKQIADKVETNFFRINYLLKKTRQQFKVKNNVELIATLLNSKTG
jgi:DNA-binding NarL/FixJ family response regulator